MVVSTLVRRTLLIIVYVVMMYECQIKEKVVQHSCNAVPSDSNSIRIIFRVRPRDEPVYKIYAFNAATRDVTKTVNRIASCSQEYTGTTDTDNVEFDNTFDTTSTGTLSCGAELSTDVATNVKIVSLLFRVYAYNDTMLTKDDDGYWLACRLNDLTANFITTEQVVPSDKKTIISLAPQIGTHLVLRREGTLEHLDYVTVGEKVLLSAELNLKASKGADSYGTRFVLGFLGNDLISGDPSDSARALFIAVLPRYKVRTDVKVTTMHGVEYQNSTDGSPMYFNFPEDLMGCSDDGEAEIEYLGIEVYSYHRDVSVLVYNREADTEGYYTALPVDVTGTDYYAVSMAQEDNASELLIVAAEDTDVKLTLPASTTQSITINNTAVLAGESYDFRLSKLQACHIAVTSTSSDPNDSITGFRVQADENVSVFSGNRNFSGDHVVEQLLPTSQGGKHFVLTPSPPNANPMAANYIVQAVVAGVTGVKVYTGADTYDEYTIEAGSHAKIDLTDTDGPRELEANQSVLVTQFANIPTGSPAVAGYAYGMVAMLSVRQWAPSYVIHTKGHLTVMPMVFKSEDSVDLYRLDGEAPAITATEVSGPSGYRYFEGSFLSSDDTHVIASSDSTTPFQAIAYVYKFPTATSDFGAAYQPAGFRVPTPFNGNNANCQPVDGRPGDGEDNDCDYEIDEEIADGIDNDNDGYIDEDTIGVMSAEYVGYVDIRPVSCMASAFEDFSDKVVQITDENGCAVPGSGPFRPESEFIHQTGATIGPGTQHKILFSGEFEIGMFADEPKLYFRCEARYCYMECPETCVAPVLDRKKREVEPQSTKTISTDVFVLPYATSQANQSCTAGGAAKSSVQTCLQNTHVQIMFSMLLILAFLCFMTAVCFCCLFRRHRREQKTNTTYYHGYRGSRKSF